MFYNIIDNLITQGWHCQPSYFSDQHIAELNAYFQNKQFKLATVGNVHNQQNTNIRQDIISWIEDKDKSNQAVYDYLHHMQAFQQEVNQELFLSLKEFECHFAQYDKGGFYKKHLDSFKLNNKRQITTITYLNENWNTNNGGELKIYLPENKHVSIQPIAGTTIFFISTTIEHEVLPAYSRRRSITGWFKN